MARASSPCRAIRKLEKHIEIKLSFALARQHGLEARSTLRLGNLVTAAEIGDRTVPSLKSVRSVRHVASLDGLRAFAVFAVMYYHARLPFYHFGWIGVDLFFVLSGFLITTLLAKEHALNGRVSLPKFWGRRFLRLMPAYWLFVGVCTILIVRGVGTFTPDEGWSKGRYIASLWGYFTNYAPLELWQYQDISSPLWSLAIEEQFYFVWPFVCALALMTRRPWITGWLLLLATLICRHFAGDDFILHTMLYTRGLSIIAGCVVALSLRGGPPRWVSQAVNSAVLRWGMIATCILFFATGTFVMQRWGVAGMETAHQIFVPLAAVLFPCLVVMLWYGPRDRISRALSHRQMVYIGRISYGIYLYHALFKWLIWDKFPHLTGHFGWSIKVGLRTLAYFGGTLTFASLSYYAIERPFLKLKERLR